MSDRIVLEAGTQHLQGEVRLAVTDAGTDDAGPYAAVRIGSFPATTDVRLRTGVPHQLPDGRMLHLAGVGPVGRRRPSVALEITAAP
ncbi:hypothetical protein ICW40_04210 [Actinotalea ferrariae]|uniref:hypothetical protein n=1 Tax=Actinotalea ferrariae TaxID=1386098 RepID=UPI001C8C6488|nr:hypothetical protein [Actinotalea ferrariae]MBX9244011.1 hypothetical protein [Actinotalea ferrariae]